MKSINSIQNQHNKEFKCNDKSLILQPKVRKPYIVIKKTAFLTA